MKRFLAIFGICLGAVAVLLGGYLGVKYLIGDFNPEIIVPQDIAFSQTEYYFDDGDEKYFLTVNTLTEGATETEVKLTLIGGNELKNDSTGEMFLSDGKIIIPKIAKLNQPFEITLVKDNTYQSEATTQEDRTVLNEWIVGGVSNIIATSANKLIAPATTTVYVDTPVYKTELVVLNNKAEGGNYFNTFKNVEYSDFANIETEENLPYVRAGETFYVGVKYYPSASAFKYGKSYATNLLVQYKKQIEAKIEELGIAGNNLFEDVINECSAEEVTLKQIMTAYKKLVKKLTDSERVNAEALVRFVENLIEDYESSLKFNYLLENTTTSNKVVINGKIPGTNLYELVATQNLDIANFYAYSFKNSAVENQALSNLEENADILAVLENELQKNNVLKQAGKLEIQDEEVDTLEIRGSINSSLPIDNIHTIYATKAGASNAFESFLNIKLSNSMLENVDLKDKVINVGLKFQKNVAAEWTDSTDDLLFAEESHYNDEYKIVVTNGGKTETYYRPYGESKYWQVYANNKVDSEFRVVIKYFIANDDNPLTPEDESLTYTEVYPSMAEEKNLMFSLTTADSLTENLVSWTKTNAIELKAIDIENALKLDGSLLSVKQNQEFDLSTRVNFEQVNSNVYKTIRYFIYVDGTTDDIKLSDYFDTVNEDGIYYAGETFNDGTNVYLYELNSSIIKLKHGAEVPDFTIKAIYMTISTDINGVPKMLDENRYDVIKYSAILENFEKISAIEFNFTPSLKNLSGAYSILDNANADFIERDADPDPDTEEIVDVLAVGSNKNSVLKVTIRNNEAGFKKAIENGEIKIVAKIGMDDTQNFIESSLALVNDDIAEFKISTKQLEKAGQNIVVKLYIVYSVGNSNYYFALTKFVDQFGGELNVEDFEIFANTDSSARYNFLREGVEKIEISRVYDEVKNAPTEKYTVYYADGTSEVVDPSTIYFDNVIRVLKTSFLGKEETDGKWYLTSSQDSVCSISADGKTMTLNNSGTTVVKLYINGIDSVQDEIKIVYTNNGYVSYYWYLDGVSNKTKVKTFTQIDQYENTTESITVSGKLNQVIYIRDDASIIADNLSLFTLWYYLEDGDGDNTNNNKKLQFVATLSDANSIANYEAISGFPYNEELPDSFSIRYNVGNTTTLNIVYTCVQIPTILMRINLTITPVITVEKFEVTDNSNNKVIETGSYTYNVYAGHNYKFSTIFNDGTESANYWVKDESGIYKRAQDVTDKLIKYDSSDGKFYFNEVKEKTEFRIFIGYDTNMPSLGHLQHEIVFIVNPNIVLTKTSEIDIELSTDGTGEMDIINCFERQIGESRPFTKSDFSVTKTKNISNNGSKVIFTFNTLSTGFVTNNQIVSVAVTFAGKNVGSLTFKVVPHNYEKNEGTYVNRFVRYNGEKAIVLINGIDTIDTKTVGSTTKYLPELITTDGTLFNLSLSRDEMFGNQSVRVAMGNFADYMSGDKVNIGSEDGLLVNTRTYLTIQDNKGNKTNYLIIISQLPYPFVNIHSTNSTFEYKNLDLHKLFVEQDISVVKEYYQDNNLYVGKGDDYISEGGYFGGDNINLVKAGTYESVYAIEDISKISEFILALVDVDDDVNNYVSLSDVGDEELITNYVGQDVYVLLTLKYRIGRQPLSIPVLILIKQSQRLLVNYPYDDSDFDATGEQNLGAYGTEAYDQQYMLQDTQSFNNAIMEYINFNQEGIAQLVLTDNRFIVQEYTLTDPLDPTAGKLYQTINNYNLGFKFEVESLYAKNGTTWTKVNEDKIYNYVTLNENILTINRHGLIGFRIKLKVTTLSGTISGVKYSGGASNYYYIQAGDVGASISLTLFKKSGGVESTAYFNEQITVNNGSKIAIHNTTTTGIEIYYYLKTNLDKLSFRVIAKNGLTNVDYSTKEIEVLLSPNEASFNIEIYTIYGILSTISVKVNAHYSAELKEDVKIYSGTELDLADFIEFKSTDASAVGVTTILNLDEINEANLTPIQFNNYLVKDGKVRFAHSTKAYVINEFKLWIRVVESSGTYYYYLQIPQQLQINVGITTEYITGQKDLGEYDLAEEAIIIEKETYQDSEHPAFKFLLDEAKYYDIEFTASCNGATLDNDGEDNFTIPLSAIGTITKQENIYIDIVLTAKNINGETISIVAKCKVTINPKYTVAIRYSNNEKLEYIKEGTQKIDFSELTTLEGNKAIYVTNSSGTESTFSFSAVYNESKEPQETCIDGESTEIDFTDLKAGVYEATIKIDNIVYGSYRFEVRTDDPYSIIENQIDEQTFIAGYGADAPFKYGADLILTLPQISEAQTRTIVKFDVVAKYTDSSGTLKDEKLMTEVNYYEGLKKVRYPIELGKMSKVKANNIYVEYFYYNNLDPDKKVVDNPAEVICTNCEITQRYRIAYNGKPIDYQYYKNIFDIEATGELSEELTTDPNKQCYVYKLTSKIATLTNVEISNCYYIECDIEMTLPDDDIHYVMNANEYKETGLSLVNMFNIKDKLGNMFYVNQVSGEGDIKFNLTQTSQVAVVSTDNIGSQNAIRIEPDILDEKTFDYKLKALGATNNGTIVTFKLAYSVNDVKFEQLIKIKVLPDYVVSVLNNDENSTENSYVNRLELENGESVMLIDSTQTTPNNDKYYIYVYSKYDESTKNVAQSLRVIQDSNSKYGSTSYIDGNIWFTYSQRANFGDKNIQLTLSDLFGYTFNYYITLAAQISIPEGAISLTEVNYYEDSTLKVYNATGTKDTGIAISLVGTDAKDEVIKLLKDDVKITYEHTSAEPVALNLEYPADKGITFKYQTQEFWNSVAGGISVTLKLLIPITLVTDNPAYVGEIFIVEQNIVLNRRYELKVKEENTYVRDNVSFNAEHLVSVYDYSQNAYLGEPEINYEDAIRLNFKINESYVIGAEAAKSIAIDYEYETGQFASSAFVELSNFNVYAFMLARAEDKISEFSGSFKIVYYKDGSQETIDDKNNTVADIVLSALKMEYREDDKLFAVSVDVKAKHNTTSQVIQGDEQLIFFEYDGTKIKPKANNIIYVNSSFGGQDLLMSSYSFEISQIPYKNETDLIKAFSTANNVDMTSANSIFANIDTTVKATTAEKTKIPVLKVTSAEPTTIIIKYKATSGQYCLETINIESGTKKYNIEDSSKFGAELFTGMYKLTLTGSVYTIATAADVAGASAEGATYTCGYVYNGLTVEAAKTAKNIQSVSFVLGEGESATSVNSVSLEKDATFAYDDKLKVLYQSIVCSLNVTFKTHSAIKFTEAEMIRATLKYTGINTSEVYTGTADMAYIEFNINDPDYKDKVKPDANGCSIVESEGGIEYSLTEWSEGFKLQPGVGVNAELAKYYEADMLGFNTNSNSLIFKLKQVQSSGDDEPKGGLVTLDNAGSIKLNKGFNLSSYYITIEVYCKYPIADATSTECSKSIGEVYLAFNVVQNKYKEAKVNPIAGVDVTINDENKTTAAVDNKYLQTDYINADIKIDAKTYTYANLISDATLMLEMTTNVEGITFDLATGEITIAEGTDLSTISQLEFKIYNLNSSDGYVLKEAVIIGEFKITVNKTLEVVEDLEEPDDPVDPAEPTT